MFGVPLINIAALLGSLGLSLALWIPVQKALSAIGLRLVGTCVAYAGCMATLIALLIKVGQTLGFKR